MQLFIFKECHIILAFLDDFLEYSSEVLRNFSFLMILKVEILLAWIPFKIHASSKKDGILTFPGILPIAVTLPIFLDLTSLDLIMKL